MYSTLVILALLITLVTGSPITNPSIMSTTTVTLITPTVYKYSHRRYGEEYGQVVVVVVAIL